MESGNKDKAVTSLDVNGVVSCTTRPDSDGVSDFTFADIRVSS